MKKLINSFPSALLCVYIGKLLIIGAQWTDVPVVFGLLAFVYLQSLKPDTEKLEALEKELAEIRKDHQEVRSYLNAIKLSQNMRSVNGGR